MTAAVGVHALLLSLGGLVGVNSLRALAESEKDKWEALPTRHDRLHFRDPRRRGWSIADLGQNKLQRRLALNTVIGSFGVLCSLVATAFLADAPYRPSLVGTSIGLVLGQLVVFYSVFLASLDYLGRWVKKAPSDDSSVNFR